MQDQIVVKDYKGRHFKATHQYKADIGNMAAQGYWPISQCWIPGEWSRWDFFWVFLLCFIAIGILFYAYMLVGKPVGILSVTYGLQSDEERKKWKYAAPSTPVASPDDATISSV